MDSCWQVRFPRFVAILLSGFSVFVGAADGLPFKFTLILRNLPSKNEIIDQPIILQRQRTNPIKMQSS